MDGVANVAGQQQLQTNMQETQGRESAQVEAVVKQPKQVDIVKEIQKENSNTNEKINSKEQVQELVKQLNDAMSPITTDIKFGVDRDDIFYVSVIEEKTNKMLRRFPAEQAMDFLPKMQEVVGILFDSKG
ncbi:MAG: flagellar protein FlaG [Sulfurimonas sp.]|uniref:flagellar protein FlaG n=1 Tax=Sulfurimonas sp. TaxID=2022749 RepID=UPI0025E7CA42|nr:flagellar protein FlaG [Sulfurimonas sp.]MCK9491020.1 flagellar protein FlaG [Sulfurimonas sp.]